MELKDRLRLARKNAGLTQKDIEKNIPNMKQSTYSELERGLSKSTSRIVELANLFKVDTDWLASGDGDMTYKDISKFDLVGGDGETPKAEDYVMINEYDIKGSCGDGSLVGDIDVAGGFLFRRDWLKALNLKGENLSVIYAQGDSMSPTIEDGTLLLIDNTAKQPQSAKIYLVCINDQLYIKRLVNMFDKWIMRSDNPDKNNYPDIELDAKAMGQIDIQARVVWQAGLL